LTVAGMGIAPAGHPFCRCFVEPARPLGSGCSGRPAMLDSGPAYAVITSL